jgi:hypothetical protein
MQMKRKSLHCLLQEAVPIPFETFGSFGGFRRVICCNEKKLKSLILAQNERWRRG